MNILLIVHIETSLQIIDTKLRIDYTLSVPVCALSKQLEATQSSRFIRDFF